MCAATTDYRSHIGTRQTRISVWNRAQAPAFVQVEDPILTTLRTPLHDLILMTSAGVKGMRYTKGL